MPSNNVGCYYEMQICCIETAGRLFDADFNAKQGSEEWKTAREQLEQARQTVPVERYKAACGGADVDHSFCVYSPLVEEERAMIATR